MGAWGEYSVTYATLPSLGSAAQTVSVGQAGAYVVVDVTALVQGWVSAPATNNGVALTAGTAVVQFDSKENDLTGHAAVLEVTLASRERWDDGASRAGGAAGRLAAARPDRREPLGPAGRGGAGAELTRGPMRLGSSYALNDVVTFAGSSLFR